MLTMIKAYLETPDYTAIHIADKKDGPVVPRIDEIASVHFGHGIDMEVILNTVS